MIRMGFVGLLVVMTAGCAGVTSLIDRTGLRGSQEVEAPGDPFVAQPAAVSETTLAPATAAPTPPASAQTAAALDTTTAAQRAAASAAPEAPSKALGKTVVSLGDPTEPGLWLKTPLVQAEAQGRVRNPATGKSSLVTLLPLEGPETAGSRMSLSALRLIEAPLTALTEVEVALEG